MEFNPMKYHRPRTKGYDFYNPKEVKAKKDYECAVCGGLIPKGTPCISFQRPRYNGWKDKGYRVTRHCCMACYEKIKKEAI